MSEKAPQRTYGAPELLELMLEYHSMCPGNEWKGTHDPRNTPRHLRFLRIQSLTRALGHGDAARHRMSKAVEGTLAPLDAWIIHLIDPEERTFTEEWLRKHHEGFEEDLREVDLDWV